MQKKQAVSHRKSFFKDHRKGNYFYKFELLFYSSCLRVQDIWIFSHHCYQIFIFDM